MNMDNKYKDNQVLPLITAHSSVRNFDPEISVPEEDEDSIIQAAQMASSSCNLQSYSFITIRDKKAREQLSHLSGDMRAVRDAGLMLIVCVDQYKLDFAAERAGVEYYQFNFIDSFIMGIADAAIAAQNAALAAESLGYGICYIGIVRQKMQEIIDLLKLPPKVFPLCGIAVGTAMSRNPVKPRLPIQGVRFRDTYDIEAAKNAVLEYDLMMAAAGIYEGRRFPLEGRKVKKGIIKKEEAHYGWIEHTARRISSTAEEDTRSGLGKILEKAGFLFR